MGLSEDTQHAAANEIDIDRELDDARQKMQAVYDSNREQMRQLLRLQKEQQDEYQKLKAKSDAFESQAIEATQRGDRQSALSFITQKQELTQPLTIIGTSLASTNQTVESVTAAIARQRKQIEEIAFEAILLKTQLAAADIQDRISETLEQMDFGMEFESFKAGKEIIDTLNFENLARAEVFGERLDYQMAALDESIENESAEDELKRLEKRMASGEIKTPNVSTLNDLGEQGFGGDQSDEEFLASINATIEGLGLDDALKNLPG